MAAAIFEPLQKQADEGDAKAQCKIALLYLHGCREVQKNELLAFQWFCESARQNYPPAQYELACMYLTGSGILGLQADEERAFKWFMQAATRGVMQAQFCVAMMMEHGLERRPRTPPRYTCGPRSGTRVDQGAQNPPPLRIVHECPEFQHLLVTDLDGVNDGDKNNVVPDSTSKWLITPDAERAKTWYARAANKGCMDSHYRLGLLQQESGDMLEAMRHMTVAAESGDRRAQQALGLMLVAADRCDMAVKWFRAAADQGLSDAKYHLGKCLLEQCAADRKAYAHIREAADQGHVVAQLDMGIAYRDGRPGVEKNATLAVDYLSKAALAGNDVTAQEMVAEMYTRGHPKYRGLRPDAAMAAHWYQKAAAQGSIAAELALAHLAYEEDRDLDALHRSLTKAHVLNSGKWQLRTTYLMGTVSEAPFFDDFYLKEATFSELSENVAKVFAWYREAANMGMELAMHRAACYQWYLSSLGDVAPGVASPVAPQYLGRVHARDTMKAAVGVLDVINAGGSAIYEMMVDALQERAGKENARLKKQRRIQTFRHWVIFMYQRRYQFPLVDEFIRRASMVVATTVTTSTTATTAITATAATTATTAATTATTAPASKKKRRKKKKGKPKPIIDPIETTESTTTLINEDCCCKGACTAPAWKDCAHCGAAEGTVPGSPRHAACSRCRMTFYCSRSCQKMHWTRGGHKKCCLTPEERRVPEHDAKQDGVTTEPKPETYKRTLQAPNKK